MDILGVHCPSDDCVPLMKVLFVCSGNAHRSPLAEALLKKARSDLKVDSAGLRVAIPISEEIKNYLTKHSASKYLTRAPESLDDKNLVEYDLIVAIQEGHKAAVVGRCPECKTKTVVWNIDDPYFMAREDAEKVYEQIGKKVVELAQSL